MKNQSLSIIFILFLSCAMHGQQVKKCDNMIFIRNDNKSDISKNPTYKNYLILESKEDCFDHKIIKDSADYFYVIPFFSTTKQQSPLWLQKTDLIRMAIRHTSGTLMFYSQPDANSKISNKLDIDKLKLFDLSVVVLNCEKGWYKIKLTLKGKQSIGWVKEGELCSNPCTTCS